MVEECSGFVPVPAGVGGTAEWQHENQPGDGGVTLLMVLDE